MDDTGDGAEIARRREALSMDISELARRAQVDRATLTALERGTKQARPATVQAILRVLDALEREVRTPAEPPAPTGGKVVSYRLEGRGVTLTIEGPVEDMTRLESSVAALLAAMQSK